MSFSITEIGPCKKRAEFSLTSGDVQVGFDEVYEEICDTISFPGFRKGRVPRNLVAKKYGKDIVGEVREKLIHKSFSEMVEGEKLELISQPRFDERDNELSEGKEFAFSVSFEVKPEIELPEYKGLKLTKKVREVTDESIEDTRTNVLRSHASYEELEEALSEEDDVVVGSLEVKDKDGEVVHHNHEAYFQIGENRMEIFPVDGLFKKLKGKKKGDSIEVKVDLPEPFPAKEELSGQKVTVSFEISNCSRRKIPEFNEDFVKNLGFENEEAFNETMTKMLEQEYDRVAKREMKEQIFDLLNEKVKTDLPEDTVKSHSDYLVNMKLYELVRSGLPMEEAESKRDEFQEDSLDAARKEIKVGFTLSMIADAEKVFVTEREINQRIVQLAQQRQMNPEKMREELEKKHELSGIRNQIKEEKVVDLIIKKAEVSEEAFKEEAEAKSKAKPKAKKAASKAKSGAKKSSTAKKKASEDA